jgi:hypothetical protein
VSGPEILIPMTFFLTVGGVLIARGEIGKAIAHRIRGGSPTDERVHRELAEVRQELDLVHQELAEMNERIDFAERLLSRSSGSAPVPGDEA